MPRPPEQPPIAITVVRTGGFAGLRKQWEALPPPDEAPTWIALIEECPWDGPRSQSHGADRYAWSVSASLAPSVLASPSAEHGRQTHQAELADQDIHGPWRVLIEAVRDWSKPDQSR